MRTSVVPELRKSTGATAQEMPLHALIRAAARLYLHRRERKEHPRQAHTPVRVVGSRGRRPARVRPVHLLALSLALSTASYGIVTGRGTLALLGLAITGIVFAAHARAVTRNADRDIALLANELSDADQTRRDLEAANERLLRTNANLRTLQLAVTQGFALIDERTQGRLRQLVEEAGDDLAALVSETLTERD